MPSTYDFGGGTAVKRTQTVTIASGVATVDALTEVVVLAAESSTSDQLDTLTVTGARAGDTVILVADTGDTITVDDANIDLGAATRVMVAADQSALGLRYDGAGWSEIFWTVDADNA